MSSRKRSFEPNEFGGEWSRRKLECVEDYLESYLKVFLNMGWADLWYIDAFSGDGIQKLPRSFADGGGLSGFDAPELSSLIEGSALRALRLTEENEGRGKRGFDHFVFIELDQKKLESLERKVLRLYPTQLGKCSFVCGDVNEKLPEVLRSINWHAGRAVTFVDPFATQFRWRAMESFKGTRSDVWLLFPVQGVLRMMPKDKPPNPGFAAALDEIFGDSSWRAAYHEPPVVQPDLFGRVAGDLRRDPGTKELLGYYRGRLETIFPGVLEPAELRTGRNAPLFALYSMVANDSGGAIRVSQGIAGHLLDEMRS